MIRGGVFTLILCAVGLALLAGGIGLAWDDYPPSFYESSIGPVSTGQGTSVKRAVFADSRLWLLSDPGELWTVREGVRAAQQERLPEPALDLCVQNGHAVIVTGEGQNPQAFTVRGWVGSEWKTLATVTSDDEALVGAQCEADRLILVTTRRLVEVHGAQLTAVKLSQRLPAAPVNSSLLATPAHVFVGLNVGEFGGGLRRVDRRTGDVVLLERNSSGNPCGGPLNSECDPVTGLAAEPGRPGCVAATVGLVHMSSHGRIVEVCGDRVSRLYFIPCRKNPLAGLRRPRTRDGEPYCTEAFFGLLQKDDTLWAVGTGGIHTIDRAGAHRRTPLPRFRDYGPFAVSFDSPQVVLVLTDINQRASLSGTVPLIASR